jgi:hypothetical protein
MTDIDLLESDKSVGVLPQAALLAHIVGRKMPCAQNPISREIST